jgi:hypothetical protein
MIASNPPLGYNLQDGLCTVDDNAPAIREITRLFLAGHSYSEIRRRMNASPYRPPSGFPWSYTTIRQAIANDTYAGFPSWSGQRPEKPSPYIEALWDPDTYAAILRERQRRQRAPYTRRGAGPLTGVITCARCGRPMTRFEQAHGWYLRCSTHAHKSATGIRCHRNSLPEHRALAALADHLQELADPRALDRALDTLAADVPTDRLKRDLERAQSLVDELSAQRHRLALALAAGKIDPDIYAHTDGEISGRLHVAQSQAVDLRRALDALPDLEEKKKALAALAKAFGSLLRQADPAELASLLQLAGVSILCESGRVVRITP